VDAAVVDMLNLEESTASRGASTSNGFTAGMAGGGGRICGWGNVG
jgi:hypothetical protein